MIKGERRRASVARVSERDRCCDASARRLRDSALRRPTAAASGTIPVSRLQARSGSDDRRGRRRGALAAEPAVRRFRPVRGEAGSCSAASIATMAIAPPGPRTPRQATRGSSPRRPRRRSAGRQLRAPSRASFATRIGIGGPQPAPRDAPCGTSRRTGRRDVGHDRPAARPGAKYETMIAFDRAFERDAEMLYDAPPEREGSRQASLTLAPLFEAAPVIRSTPPSPSRRSGSARFEFLSPKGTLPHRTIGWVWATLMMLVAGTSLFIRHDTDMGALEPHPSPVAVHARGRSAGRPRATARHPPPSPGDDLDLRSRPCRRPVFSRWRPGGS